jgi:ABC-type phosphate/phosphonate transport system substrate-binding protein
MKRLLLLLLVAIYGCGLRNSPHPTASPTPIIATVTPTATPLAPLPTAALGDVKNPLILALAPAPRLDPNALNAGNVLIAHLEKSIGYQFNTIAPTSETDLINRFDNGDAHIGVLSPFGYLLASENGSVDAAFARQQSGSAFYGAQFIVRSDAGFLPYFDSVKNENTADVSAALAQFQNKKTVLGRSIVSFRLCCATGFSE